MTIKMIQDETQYLVVENWGDHLHPDTKRKAKPPYRWIKLRTEALDVQGDMSLREYGAYCRILMLAGLTNNVTVFRPGFIKRRTGVTQNDIKKLQKRGLISIKDKPPDSKIPQENQSTDSESASKRTEHRRQAAGESATGRDGTRSDLTRRENKSLVGVRPNGRQPSFGELTNTCQVAGISGSDWDGIASMIEEAFHFTPSKRQLSVIQQQLNDRQKK